MAAIVDQYFEEEIVVEKTEQQLEEERILQSLAESDAKQELRAAQLLKADKVLKGVNVELRRAGKTVEDLTDFVDRFDNCIVDIAKNIDQKQLDREFKKHAMLSMVEKK